MDSPEAVRVNLCWERVLYCTLSSAAEKRDRKNKMALAIRIFQKVQNEATLELLKNTVRGASKIKVKNVNKKRMATARRLIFFGISQGIHC